MICLTLTGKTIRENKILIQRYKPFIDMVELRFDFMEPAELENLVRMREAIHLPAIATFRKKSDGGNYQGNEGYRIKKLLEAVNSGFDYVDIEYDSNVPLLEKKAASSGVKLIKSYHSFTGVPDNLEDILMKASSHGKNIAKAAVFPKNSADVLKLLNIIENVKDMKRKIILGMGEYGFFTRILYKKIGSLLTFCSEDTGSGAPGQISPRKAYEIYNIDRISSSAKVYGIIGNPVMHSHSPQFHNAGFRKYNLDAVYVPFPVDNIQYFLEFMSMLNVRGFSVTVPHKTGIVPFLNKKDHLVSESGACNTVVVTDKGINGWNTDVEGFLTPLKKIISMKKIQRTAVIGAGGAAAAVVQALKKGDTEIHIFNRTREKAVLLADRHGAFPHPLTAYTEIAKCDLIVQTTNAGMSPALDETPLPGYRFLKNQIVYDLIYTPLETLFLKQAAEQGCRTINGKKMLIAQGKQQFKLFTGRMYPYTGA